MIKLYMSTLNQRTFKLAARKTRQSGFSLVEIALVLVIAGLALGAGLALLNSRLAQSKIDNTRVKTEAVRVALVNYVAQNFRMPCPADPLIIRGAANYNRAIPDTGAACTASAGLITNVGNAAPLGVSRGTVPCTTLGLPEDTCIDGWGVRLTYFVQNSAVVLTRATVSGMRGTMTVHTITPPAAAAPVAGLAPTGNQINACNATANDNTCNLAAVAMIISHGANRGGGFYPTSAVALPAVVGTDISAYEAENSNNNIQFIQNDFIEALPNAFDDILVAVVPRDVISTLNQTGIVKQPNVFMNERFELIKLALLQHAYINSLPGTSRTLQLAAEGGGAAPYPFTAANIPPPCPLLPATTQLLPLIATTPALYVAGGIVNDAWGRPVRYIRVVTSVTNTLTCAIPFVLLSYGPNGVANTGAATDDDVISFVTFTDINAFVLKYGGW